MSEVMFRTPRILITGTGSGCGKTTVVCAILKALKNRGEKVCAFKCGPDYIDPMFHSEVIGVPTRNLDLFLCGGEGVKTLLAKNAASSSLAVIEGAMGMYDGSGFTGDELSANHTARVTGTPEALVLNVKGKSASLLAELGGYLSFRENNVRAVILNNCSEGMYPAYRKAIEETYDVEVLGFMPSMPDASLESRHLGLVTAAETDGLKEKIETLGSQAEKSINICRLMELAASAESLRAEIPEIRPVGEKPFKIAVAKDKAFSFYYEDNFELLKSLGAEILFFSPLKDEPIPEDARGLILGGGYPEEYARDLSEAEKTKESIRKAVGSGMPVWAECGGFMYLGRSIEAGGYEYPMTGFLQGKSHMTKSLVRFGYKTLTARKDNLMCKEGQSIRCHEFHYSDSTDCGRDFDAVRRTGARSQCIVAQGNIFAGYPHIHLWSNIDFARNFASACAAFGGGTWK